MITKNHLQSAAACLPRELYDCLQLLELFHEKNARQFWAVKGQLGVLCPLQGCHSFRYRSVSHKDEYEIRIECSNYILSIYINIVCSNNVFWSLIFC